MICFQSCTCFLADYVSLSFSVSQLVGSVPDSQLYTYAPVPQLPESVSLLAVSVLLAYSCIFTLAYSCIFSLASCVCFLASCICTLAYSQLYLFPISQLCLFLRQLFLFFGWMDLFPSQLYCSLVSCICSLPGVDSFLPVCSVSCTVHLQLFTNIDILQVSPESAYIKQICSTLSLKFIANKISNGLPYIITLYLIGSLASCI